MYRDASVAVVVPAYNEARQIGKVLETMPDWIDRIYVVDDASTDETAAVVEAAAAEAERIRLIRLPENRGVGGAIEAGYRQAYEDGMAVSVVMAGDGQMDPADLPDLLDPVVAGEVDYAKGNRLIMGDAWEAIPRKRLLGNAVLSVLTKIASGYWHVADSQCGYTAIHRRALGPLLRDGIYARYGMPNDVLVKLNVHAFRVRDVPMHPVYNVGEQSKMRIPRLVLPLACLLVRLFFYRLWHRYVVRDTHPLVLFYLSGLVMLPVGILYGLLILAVRVILPNLGLLTDVAMFLRPICTSSGIILDALLTLVGFQMFLFAMGFDMQYNAQLR